MIIYTVCPRRLLLVVRLPLRARPPPGVRELNDVPRWPIKRFNMIYMSIPGGARGKELRRIALHIY